MRDVWSTCLCGDLVADVCGEVGEGLVERGLVYEGGCAVVPSRDRSVDHVLHLFQHRRLERVKGCIEHTHCHNLQQRGKQRQGRQHHPKQCIRSNEGKENSKSGKENTHASYLAFLSLDRYIPMISHLEEWSCLHHNITKMIDCSMTLSASPTINPASSTWMISTCLPTGITNWNTPPSRETSLGTREV